MQVNSRPLWVYFAISIFTMAAMARRRVLGKDKDKGKANYRMSHNRPSVAVCFFVLSSFRQRSWMFSDSAGAASWRSRSFYPVEFGLHVRFIGRKDVWLA